MRRFITIGAAAVVVVLLVGGIALALGGSGQRHATAYFERATALYKGTSVRLMGVQIGKVTNITPEGTRVRVDMVYDAKYKIPANAGAVIVPPSVVADRFVQLTPVYTSGPVMADHATIPQSRTAVPLELDQIFGNLNDLNVALGPQGANAKGALSRLIDVSAKNLKGNGQLLHDTLQNFSQAIATLGDNRGNLFGTVSNLQKFTTTIAQDDGGVRALNKDLASVAVQLNGERTDLGAALRALSIALGQVATFVRDNKGAITTDLAQLKTVSGVLVKQKAALREALDDAPLALQNLALAYDPSSRNLRTRNGGSDQRSPLQVLQQLLCNSIPTSSLPPPLQPLCGAGAAKLRPAAPAVKKGQPTPQESLQALMGLSK